MKYTRIYCDAAGESHFEDVSVNVAPVDFAPPAPPLNLAAPLEAERMILCAVPAGWVGDWHPAPHRQFYFQMSGQLEVQVSDGEIRRFSAGSLVLLEDTTGKGHLTRVVGSSGVDAVFVQLPAVTEEAI
jgi:quercetin dioxygenase-like cupin family protein